MRYIGIITFFLFLGTPLFAQKKISEKQLLQLADSVNYLLKNSEDGFVQPVFSINSEGDITILEDQKSGFRFNIFSLCAQDSIYEGKGGTVFVPERPRSITTNKFIRFMDNNGRTIALLKFTHTEDAYVRKIYDLLIHIRSYFITKK